MRIATDGWARSPDASITKVNSNSNVMQMSFTLFVTFVEIPAAVSNKGIYPDPEMERDVYEAPSSLKSFDPDTNDIFEMLKTMQGAGPQAFPQAPPTPAVPETPVSKLLRSKVPIVLLALVVYMLFALDLSYAVGGAVFSSLIVWEIFEFFMTTFVIKQPAQPGGLVNLLFIFGGVSQAKAQLILKLLGLTNKVIRDIAIFMFTFVMIHLAWSYLIVGESLTEILDKDFNNLLRSEEL